jgi:hypothetical protein
MPHWGKECSDVVWGEREGEPAAEGPNHGMEPTAYRCDVKVVRKEWS